ncbi:MAG: SDR family NAD(P)-dependent oxidoreductase [Methanomassiliicoccales archaeon]|nr:SDR family NAD(P)-dependent oxidoreductase [Methanomassiliicoccales archaeon]
MNGVAEGKVAIISGATGWLGRAVTKQALAAGMRVAIPYRNEDKLKETIAFVGGGGENILVYPAKVTSEEEMNAFVGSVIDKWGRIDILLNIAGGYRGGKEAWETPLEDFEAMLEWNFLSALVCSRAVLPTMIKQNYGKIVNVAARPGIERRGRAKSCAYAVAKAAVAVLTETIAEECRKTDVTVNAVVPSTIDTPQNRAEIPQGDFSKWTSPDDVAKVMLFLASDDSKVTSGALVPVYGKA